MKIVTCEQLGGACSLDFRADTFDEISELSKQHGMGMYKKHDSPHLEAMKEMGELMKNPENMNAWFESKRQAFESLPDC